jgi:hypothetical protein
MEVEAASSIWAFVVIAAAIQAAPKRVFLWHTPFKAEIQVLINVIIHKSLDKLVA